MVGPFAKYGERLIERGFAALPIIPGTKRPGYFFAGTVLGLANWTKRYNNGPPSKQERARWGAGDTGVGVLCGYRGLVGVDIDTDDAALRAAILAVLPTSPVSKRGAKGETLFFKGPGIQSKSWDVNGRRVVDLIGPGRQTVLPPTIHPETRAPYVWISPETLDNRKPEDLPALPSDIIRLIGEALQPFGWRPEPVSTNGGNGHGGGFGGGGDDADTPHRRLNELALENLDAWVPELNLYRCRRVRGRYGGYEAVPVWRPSTTGRDLTKRHLNLKISRIGIRDFGADEGYTPIDLVMTSDGCDLDTAFRFLAERLRFGDDDVGIDVTSLIDAGNPLPPLVEWSTSAVAVNGQAGGVEIDVAALIGEQEPKEPAPTPPSARAPPAEPKSPAPEKEPPKDQEKAKEPDSGGAAPQQGTPLEQYTYNVPGVLGEIIEWVTASARRPNRVMALSAAVSLVGTLIGRRVATPTRSAVHLYTVVIAGTGTGKQHPMDAIRRLARSAKAETHVTGPTRFFSLSAVESHLVAKPLSLCLLDEIGAFLGNVTSGRASSHERGISTILRILWGTSFSSIETTHRAHERGKVVRCPALSILGMSTPDEFFGALQGDSVTNGFLNRFLVLDGGGRVADREPQVDPSIVPDNLARMLSALYLWSGPQSLLSIDNSEAEYEPHILRWDSKAAEERWREVSVGVESFITDNPEAADYLARAADMALRLATIRAAGRSGLGATVNEADVEWGANIAWVSGHGLAERMLDFLPQNERGVMTEKIAGYVQRRHPVKLRDIQQFLKGRLRSRDIKEILDQLVEAGEIVRTADGYQPT